MLSNIKHVTIEEYGFPDIDYDYYAILRYKKHIAIPFTDVIEPSPIYKILNYYNSEQEHDDCLLLINARHRSFNYQISMYYRKHDRVKDSIYYAYGKQIENKLKSKHFIAKVVIAGNDKEIIREAVLAFKDFYTARVYDNSNGRVNLKKVNSSPSYNIFHKDNVLSHIELLSMMLPDGIDNASLNIDGLRPFSNGTIK